MLFEIKKFPNTYTGTDGKEHKGWQYRLYTPSGSYICIREVFKGDLGKLSFLIPPEKVEEDKE